MKKIKTLITTLAIAALAACNNSIIDKDTGTTESPVFPQANKASFNHDGSQLGSWVNMKNLKMIERGMNKDQIRSLIGNPHFGEGLYGVDEWDYLFNYRTNEGVAQCQYKFTFDKNHNLGGIYVMPTNCPMLWEYLK